MAFSRSFLLCGALALAGCGGLADSKVNPMNWFGKSTSRTVNAEGPTNPLIPRRRLSRRTPVYAGVPIDQIAELRIERRPGGAIVHVVGIGDVIGYYDAKLEAENDGEPVKGVLTYTFKAVRPARPVGVGSAAARRVNIATFLTDQELAAVRTITVRGARNERSTRRR